MRSAKVVESERFREQRNMRFIRSLKNKPCKDCGIKYIPEVMEFDHLRDKKFVLSKPSRRRFSTILEEISKCDLVCANCHRVRTVNRKCSGDKIEECFEFQLTFSL